jgi:hypothetical protein
MLALRGGIVNAIARALVSTPAVVHLKAALAETSRRGALCALCLSYGTLVLAGAVAGLLVFLRP